MRRFPQLIPLAALTLVALFTAPYADAHHRSHHGHDQVEVSTLADFAPDCMPGQTCGSGSTVGPHHDLYVTDPAGGRVLEIDRHSGHVSVWAEGLPPLIPQIGIGGAMDLAFHGGAAYVLVTLVGPGVGQPGVVDGLYQVTEGGTPEVVADIGQWSIDHPPVPDFFVPSGVQYAMERYRGGFLVTDGHHNRVLWVSRHGHIHELLALDDVVPTGLETRGHRFYVAEAGPVPHEPATGRVVRFSPGDTTADEVAAGARLNVDVERRGHRLFALSQGEWDGVAEGSPALPDTGALMKVRRDGTMSTVVDGLDRPTSMEVVGDDAYVVTLTGTLVKLDDAVD